MPSDRAYAMAAAETWAAHNAASRDTYLPLPWPLRFWLWRRRQYAKLGAWARKWYRVWYERRHGPRRERAVFPVPGALMVHPKTLEHLAATLPRADAYRLYGERILCSVYVPEWRERPTLDAAGNPKWSPRFQGLPRPPWGTDFQVHNTVLALDEQALVKAQRREWPL